MINGDLVNGLNPGKSVVQVWSSKNQELLLLTMTDVWTTCATYPENHVTCKILFYDDY